MHTAEHTAQVAEVASRLTKAGAGVAASSPVVRWLVENSEAVSIILGIAGLLVAAAGVAVSWYYNHQRTQIMRETAERQERDNG